ncbi:restriction endonuclease subunit S [Saccharospirillum salsuginis]|nr:restriction endonuclease subunit S [Saccharospirillum salsuginis]
MRNWNDVPFVDLLVESRDGEWGKGEPEVGHTEAVLIRGTDFAGINEPDQNLPRRWIKNHLVERKKLQPGDIVFEMAGGTSTQSTGRSALLKRAFFDNNSPLPAVCASFSRHLRIDQSKFCSEFVYYLLQSLHTSGYMGVFHIQHTGVARFQYSSFKKHTVLKIPNLHHQRKIAAILTAYDDLIEVNKRRIALLENMADEIYREWFVRLRFPGYQNTGFTKGVPKGWDFVPILEASRIQYGKNLPTSQLISNGEFPVYGAAKIIGRYSKFTHDHRTIALGCRGSVGEVKITHPKSYITNNSFSVEPLEKTGFFWLYHTLKLRGCKDVIGGSAQPQITLEGIKSIKLLMADEVLRDNFEELCEPIYGLKWHLDNQLEVLTKTRDLLLPRLITGKLSVEDLDIQFPPSMQEAAANQESQPEARHA